jgi:hypothetical protein
MSLTWHPAVMGCADDDAVRVSERVDAERCVEVHIFAIKCAIGGRFANAGCIQYGSSAAIAAVVPASPIWMDGEGWSKKCGHACIADIVSTLDHVPYAYISHLSMSRGGNHKVVRGLGVESALARTEAPRSGS